jgi:hypothetical protein
LLVEGSCKRGSCSLRTVACGYSTGSLLILVLLHGSERPRVFAARGLARLLFRVVRQSPSVTSLCVTWLQLTTISTIACREGSLVLGLLRRGGPPPSAGDHKKCCSGASCSTGLSNLICDSNYCDGLHYTHWTDGGVEVFGASLQGLCANGPRRLLTFRRCRLYSRK